MFHEHECNALSTFGGKREAEVPNGVSALECLEGGKGYLRDS